MSSSVSLPTRSGTRFDSIRLFGVPVANVTPAEAVECVRDFLDEDTLHHIAVVNTNKFWLANHVDGVNKILMNAEMVIPEFGAVWASRILGSPLKANVRGVGLFLSLIPRFEEWGASVYFLGAREEVLQGLLSRVRCEYPGLRIAGSRNGYFSPSEEGKIVADINSSGADVLFVAMGSPNQEFFIERHKTALHAKVAMGVGGSFDVLAGLKKDAPAWSHCGIEWLYRLWLDPKNLMKRYMRVHPWFVWYTLRVRVAAAFRETGLWARVRRDL
jgi:N-acetylglucosaminyldiphosphoundecaprenol N-acetyl-beta-D-mannosaminyltransferase